MSNNNKVKGLLKGLRFISQIFDSDDKDSDIQIGHPTDVKHVAHVGWDGHGPSENNPSWMNEFMRGDSSAPKNHNGEIHSKESNDSINRAPEDSMERRSSCSMNGECDEMLSSECTKSKRQSNSIGSIRETQAKEKSDRPRRPKRSSKSSEPHDSCQAAKHTDQDKHTDDCSLQQDSDLAPKVPRSKMSKDGSHVGRGSSKSRSKASSKDSHLEGRGHGRRTSKSRNKQESLEEKEHFERESSENVLKSNLN